MYDYKGREWIVREERQTEHGFSIYLGGLFGTAKGYKTVIPTKDLAEYLLLMRKHDLKDLILPVRKTPLSFVVKELNKKWFAERETWWQEKEQDLSIQPAKEFAAQNGISLFIVSLRQELLRQEKFKLAQTYMREFCERAKREERL